MNVDEQVKFFLIWYRTTIYLNMTRRLTLFLSLEVNKLVTTN